MIERPADKNLKKIAVLIIVTGFVVLVVSVGLSLASLWNVYGLVGRGSCSGNAKTACDAALNRDVMLGHLGKWLLWASFGVIGLGGIVLAKAENRFKNPFGKT